MECVHVQKFIQVMCCNCMVSSVVDMKGHQHKGFENVYLGRKASCSLVCFLLIHIVVVVVVSYYYNQY